MTAPIYAPIEDARESEDAPAPDAQGETARGKLLDLSDAQAAKEAERLWKQNAWFHKRKAGESKQHAMWRSGQRFLKLITDRDNGTVRVVSPVGTEALPPTPNKVEELVKNAISILMSDPPRLECEPSGDSAQARDAAQFSTRYLMAVSGESGLNLDQVLYGMFDIAATYSSGFAEVCYDRTAGGYVPLSIKARPSAKTTATAETGEMPDGSPDQAPFVTRYVMPVSPGAPPESAALSESPTGAQMTWQAGIIIDLLNSDQVRFLPRRSRGIADAKGVVIGQFLTWGVLKARYPKVRELGREALEEIVKWTVSDYKRLLPEGYQYEGGGKFSEDEDADEPDDETLICALKVYYKSHPSYPKGAACVFVGGKYRIHAEEWSFANTEGAPEMLDLPLAQMVWEIDVHGGDPYGTTTVRRLGPMDEMRATQYASGLEYLFRFSRPRRYLPMGTLWQPEDDADLDKPIFFPPGGKPEFQQLPDFPQMGMQLVDRIDSEMANTMGIQGPALGQIAGSVRSAEQQKTLIEQSNVALTALRANGQDAAERLGRIILQQARAWLDVPQLMSYRGMDGAYQVQEFTRADFGSTKQVRVQRGSFTMLTPTAKNELIGMEMQMGGLRPEQAARLRRDNISALVGVQDDPHVLRVRRQLLQWREGPPEELAQKQPEPQIDPATGQPAIDPMTGQPVMTDPVLMAAQAIFQPLPVDEEQGVAMLRHLELQEAVAEIEFYKHPPGWKQALMNAYMQARQAAGIQTIAEQQQAMAQQQAQQQQAEQQKEQGAKDERQSEKQQDRQFQMERDAAKNAQAQEREATRMAMQSQGVA